MAKQRKQVLKSKLTSNSGVRMQNVRFRSIDEFLEYLPAKELKIVNALRQIVFDCIPGVTESLSYNVPYYRVRKTICFIWPASILWGRRQTYQGVRFGFAKGYRLLDEMRYLDRGDRKQVYWKDFNDLKEIDVALLKSYIYEAILLDI
jgi:hypothetical protein